jgi:hypothetical protein
MKLKSSDLKKLDALYWELRKRKRTSIDSRKVKETQGLIQIDYCTFFYEGKAVFFKMGVGNAEYFRLATLFTAKRLEISFYNPYGISSMVEILRQRMSRKKLGKMVIDGIQGRILKSRMKLSRGRKS